MRLLKLRFGFMIPLESSGFSDFASAKLHFLNKLPGLLSFHIAIDHSIEMPLHRFSCIAIDVATKLPISISWHDCPCEHPINHALNLLEHFIFPLNLNCCHVVHQFIKFNRCNKYKRFIDTKNTKQGGDSTMEESVWMWFSIANMMAWIFLLAWRLRGWRDRMD